MNKEELNQKVMNEVRITVPEGMEIDRENSTFECIKFKPKAETYEDVAKKLFSFEDYFFISNDGKIEERAREGNTLHTCDANNCTTTKQAAKLLAINKLMNVAKYLNDGWQPDWEKCSEKKWYFSIEKKLNQIVITFSYTFKEHSVYFKSKELAERALAILGEETIRLALCTDY